jgi:hypothetical protein
VLASIAFAGLAGLAVGAFRLDLPRRGLGWIHAATIGGLAFAGFLVAAGVGPALWRGDWDPGRTAGEEAALRSQISALLVSEAEQVGDFRTLWVGDRWTSGEPSAIRLGGDYILSGPQGERLTDLYEIGTGRGESRFRDVVSSIVDGGTDLGGHFLGAFNVDFVIVSPGPFAEPWLGQRDLALIRSEPAYLVLRNEASLARAGVYDELPAAPGAVDTSDAASFAGTTSPTPSTRLGRESPSVYSGEVDEGGSIFVAETRDEGWSARLGDRSLDRAEAGWAGAWTIPSGASGRVEVTYDRPPRAGWVLAVVIVGWAITVGAAFSRRRAQVPGVIR